jgi:Holliday junction resolvase RusA-like endonuclease
MAAHPIAGIVVEDNATTTTPKAAAPKPPRSGPKKKSQKDTEKMTVNTLETTITQVAKKEMIKKRKKRTNKPSSERDELYWRLDSDEVIFHPPGDNAKINKAESVSSSFTSHDSNTELVIAGNTILATPPPAAAASWSLLRFTVRGNPVSLQRHRSTQNGRFSYNPSAPAQEAFRNVVQDILTNNSNNNNRLLLQPEDAALAVTLIFHRKRPLNHFMSSKRGPGRLKSTAPSFIGYSPSANDGNENSKNSKNNNRIVVSIFQSDVDNLAKFVLDALNGFLYVDDKQIISLTAIKLWDNDDECRGSTSVCLRVLQDQAELEAFILRQQQQQQQQQQQHQEEKAETGTKL